MNVNILGTEYEITESNRDDDVRLENTDGYVDHTTKRIVIDEMKPREDSLALMETYKQKVIRHEVIHAFLIESGLSSNSWGENEEIVDWIALQFPKIRKVIDEIYGGEK